MTAYVGTASDAAEVRVTFKGKCFDSEVKSFHVNAISIYQSTKSLNSEPLIFLNSSEKGNYKVKDASPKTTNNTNIYTCVLASQSV